MLNGNRYWFIAPLFFAILSSLFNMIALISVSDKVDDVKNLAWAIGSGGGAEMFVSLFEADRIQGLTHFSLDFVVFGLL